MRLVMYELPGSGHSPAAVRAGWVEDGGDVVDLLAAYDWRCACGGNSQPEFRACIVSLDRLVRASAHGDRWVLLQELQHEWRRAAAAGDERALACRVGASGLRLRMPVSPESFRDFYAFEQHVQTARRRRGLDMVPEWYQFPVFYFSNTRSFRGPGDPVWAPSGSAELDFELEVACILGAPASSVSARDADACIAGYTVLNDWSARDLQRAEMKVGLGPAKGKDFATSIGPYFVTPDELADVAIPSERGVRHDLAMTAVVNGRQISSGNLKDLHFTFAEMIERASRDVELVPGDVIGSGTVGTGCILELGTEIQGWLAPGDVVELTVERLGTLRTPVIERPCG